MSPILAGAEKPRMRRLRQSPPGSYFQSGLRKGQVLFIVCLALSPLYLAVHASEADPSAFGSTHALRPGLDSDVEDECTIAVVTGAVTVDGRPLFWKNRDWVNGQTELVYFDDAEYSYLTLITAGDSAAAKLGVNELGFAVMNSLSHNLPDDLDLGITNGALMKHALGTCRTVSDFEDLLNDASIAGLQSPSNFGVIDATGGAFIFEAGNHAFSGYDANDPVAAPDGFLVRANFSFSADTSQVNTWRYHRAYDLIGDAAAQGVLDLEAVLRTSRDLTSATIDPYPLPYPGSPPADPNAIGFIDASHTINRYNTTSFGVIRGVKAHEDPRLTTFYGSPGQPVVTMVVPLWVTAGPTPAELDGPETCPLGDLARLRMLQCYNGTTHRRWLNTFFLDHGSGENEGFLIRVEEIEDWLLAETEAYLEDWYANGVEDSVLAVVEHDLVQRAFADYELPIAPPAGIEPTDPFADLRLICRPNPMTGETVFGYASAWSQAIKHPVTIWEASGRRVRTLLPAYNPGDASLRWDGRDRDGHPVEAGVYFYRAAGDDPASRGSIVVVR